ncbi:hypothetical protein Hanom_Chr00s001056g01673321 [Helianthus anomalus]
MGFDARFLTIEQQIIYILRRVYELEEELTYVLSFLFFSPPPPPRPQYSRFLVLCKCITFGDSITIEQR